MIGVTLPHVDAQYKKGLGELSPLTEALLAGGMREGVCPLPPFCYGPDCL